MKNDREQREEEREQREEEKEKREGEGRATLYLCYFGLREPLVQTQVLPYLRRLAGEGRRVFLLTFEPSMKARWPRDERDEWADRLRADGIEWSCLAYHKRPSLPATMYDMVAGAWAARRLVRRQGIGVLHARAHVAAVMGGLAKLMTGRPLIFDIRGFNPEEYVDAGVWRAGGLKFRLAKGVERWLFRVSDGFVVLTEAAREALFPGCVEADRRGRPIEVIPCCVDGARFGGSDEASRRSARASLGLEGRRVFAYVGSVGGIYLTDAMAEFVASAREADPSTFFLVLTQGQPGPVAEVLARHGLPEDSYLIRPAAPGEVPRYLRAADCALSFRKPTYAQVAASPTKVAEYLACGLPVVCNAGIGDVDAIIEGDRVGVVLRQLDRPAYRDALRALDALRDDPETPARCVASARGRFDLESVGGARYGRLYRRLEAATP